MKVQALIKEVFTENDYRQEDALKFLKEKALTEKEIPDQMYSFIIKFKNKDHLKKKDFDLFRVGLENLLIADPNLHGVLVGLFNYISGDILSFYTENITKLRSEIDKKVNAEEEFNFQFDNQLEYYKGLLNIYALNNGLIIRAINQWGYAFPGIGHIDNKLYYDLPFFINILMLTKKIPDNYNGISLKNPIYPGITPSHPKINIKRGIKISDTYFPYKRAFKQHKGDTGDTAYVATNGKKILYLRGNKRKPTKYLASSVLASKIGAFVNKEYFSSERVLDTNVVGSKKLPAYVVTLSDFNYKEKIRKYIEEEKKVFPGTGTIDEVLNFVQESDPNSENYGLSSYNMNEAHLCKIDFDRCNVVSRIDKDQYEINRLSNPGNSETYTLPGVWSKSPNITKDKNYIKEKLTTRLKLSFLTKEFSHGLADKAYIKEDQKSTAVAELLARTDIAFDLFIENKSSSDFLKDNPGILNTLFQETIRYVNGHFDPPVAIKISNSLESRVMFIKKEIEDKLNITLSFERKAEQSRAELRFSTSSREKETPQSQANNLIKDLLKTGDDEAFFENFQQLLAELEKDAADNLDLNSPIFPYDKNLYDILVIKRKHNVISNLEELQEMYHFKFSATDSAQVQPVETALRKLSEEEMNKLEQLLQEDKWSALDHITEILFQKNAEQRTSTAQRIMKVFLTENQKENLIARIEQVIDKNKKHEQKKAVFLELLDDLKKVSVILDESQFREAINCFKGGKEMAGLGYFFDERFNLIVSLTPTQRDELCQVIEPLSKDPSFSRALAVLQPSGPSKLRPY